MGAAKKRILVCGELSTLATGYSNLSRHILTHLAETGKYELAEMANYCAPMDLMQQRDPRNYQAIQENVKWKLYSTLPYDDEVNVYNSSPMNQFGAWRYENVLLDFKPTHVITFLDIWMSIHLLRSPFRDFYKLLLMPAIDAEPQQEEWIEAYKQADKLITYTDWAGKVLEKVGLNSITNSPGVDIQTYFPSHKKTNYNGGNNADMIVIGTVMRNQKRKLYPNLINAFGKFIQYCKNRDNQKLANNTYLYIHSSYPDLGWNFCKLIKDSEYSNRILFSYLCKNCGTIFPSLFQDARTNCVKCNKYSAYFPSTQFGIPDSVLANVYNCMDLYLQIATNEGFGIPLIESAACGVHGFAVDYSAMADVVRKIKGVPIKVAQYFVESETGRNFALPDQDHLVAEMYKFLTLPESIRRKKGFDARKNVEKYFTWSRSCSSWEKIIDEIDVKDDKETWNSPSRDFNINQSFLNNPNINSRSTTEFLNLCLKNITNNILSNDSFRINQWLKQINFGMSLQQSAGSNAFSDLSFLGMRQNLMQYTGKELVAELTEIANNFNNWEKIRCGLTQYNRPKFLNNIYRGKNS